MTNTETVPSASNRVVIGGRYEVFLDQPLGSGGLARVYRGRDMRARREVAIKTLRDEFQHDPESRRRFRQEARMMAFASHPGLVTIYDLLEQPHDSWIVMELVPGQNLKQVIEREGSVSPPAVVRILEQVASALGHLHERAIVHLDIKPQNLIRNADGSIKLIDFGLAQSMAPRQDTVGGSAFGTAAYLAPEQGSGEAVDQRTDVYALGCVAYELLTGRPPFDVPEGPDQKRLLIEEHLESEPVPPSRARPDLELPDWVDDVVGRALEKDPRHRYPTVVDFAEAARDGLERGAGVESYHTLVLPSPTRTEPRIRWSRPDRSHPPVISPDRQPVEPLERGPSVARRLWKRGGKVARHTRSFRGTIWRLAMIFALGNLILGSVILVRGGPESLVERFLSVVPGATTEVSVDSLNLRTGPGAENAVIVVLSVGEDVEVTGLSETDEQGRWWPVNVDLDGTSYEGWVWSEGLQPNEWTGRMSFMQGIVEGGQDIRDGVADGIDTVTGLWPM
ncbi:MAG: protein kinase [Chloroflexia bacterium]|nr:protein kinase [Chloroflexia bacterium]